jgi:hypothetical protein
MLTEQFDRFSFNETAGTTYTWKTEIITDEAAFGCYVYRIYLNRCALLEIEMWPGIHAYVARPLKIEHNPDGTAAKKH